MMLIFAYFLKKERFGNCGCMHFILGSQVMSDDDARGSVHVLQEVDSTDFNWLHPFPWIQKWCLKSIETTEYIFLSMSKVMIGISISFSYAQ